VVQMRNIPNKKAGHLRLLKKRPRWHKNSKYMSRRYYTHVLSKDPIHKKKSVTMRNVRFILW
jgi:hypothetical protein